MTMWSAAYGSENLALRPRSRVDPLVQTCLLVGGRGSVDRETNLTGVGTSGEGMNLQHTDGEGHKHNTQCG